MFVWLAPVNIPMRNNIEHDVQYESHLSIWSVRSALQSSTLGRGDNKPLIEGHVGIILLLDSL